MMMFNNQILVYKNISKFGKKTLWRTEIYHPNIKILSQMQISMINNLNYNCKRFLQVQCKLHLNKILRDNEGRLR